MHEFKCKQKKNENSNFKQISELTLYLNIEQTAGDSKHQLRSSQKQLSITFCHDNFISTN